MLVSSTSDIPLFLVSGLNEFPSSAPKAANKFDYKLDFAKLLANLSGSIIELVL